MSQFTSEITGDVSVNNTVTVTGGLTDTELRATPVPVTIPTPVPVTDNGGSLTVDGSVSVTGEVEIKNDSGSPLPVTFSQVALTPTVSRVSVGAGAPTTLLAASGSRKRAIIVNESGTLFIKLGTAASATDYTYRLTGNTVVEIDFQQDADITAIKATGTSSVQVTSLS